MKILIVFGSESDKHIYNPLRTKLLQDHDVQFEVLSAHRNPVELDLLLRSKTFDMVVAGAGLAAHLPGVIASKVKTPVIGIPVAAALGGLDATLSILQMPFKVPVLTVGPNSYDGVVSFICLVNEKLKSICVNSINLVLDAKINRSNYQKEIDRTIQLAEEMGLDLSVGDEFNDERLNIVGVTGKEIIQKEKLAIHVPWFDQTQNANPQTSFQLLEWLLEGGAWVGINNTRNAIIFYQKLFSRRNI